MWDDPTLPGIARDLAAELGGRVELLAVARARRRGAPRRLRDGGVDVRLIGWTAPRPLRALEDAVNALRVPWELARRRRREAPALAHYHFAGNDAWLFVALAAPFFKTPLHVSVHGVLRGFPGRPLLRRLCGAVLRRARAVSAVSEAARRALVRDFPDAAPKTAVIANGVDVALFARETAGPRPHPRRYVLSVSRAEYAKGLDILLMAFAGLAASRPGLDLLVCGAEDDDGQARGLAAALGLGERVRWLGVRPKEEVAVLLRHCELMALGSRFGEADSLAALEARAAGAPVVMPSADLPAKDPGALAAAMARLLDDPAERERQAAAGRLETRGRAAMADAYLDWYGAAR